MQGITILDKTPIMTDVIPFGLSLVCMLIIVIIGLVIGFIFANNTGKNCELGMIIGELIAVFIDIIFFCNLPQRNTGRYTYKVTIDKSVSYTELTQKYDVISRENKIYTIKDKGD